MKTKIKDTLFLNRGLIVIIGLILLFSPFLIKNNLQAVTIAVSTEELSDLQDEIKDKQKQIEGLRKQKDIYERSLNQTRQQINSLKGQINNLDNIIAKLSIEIQTIELETEKVNLQMKSIELQLEKYGEDIDWEQDKIANILRILNRNSYQSGFLSILTRGNTVGEFFENINQLNKIHNSLQAELIELNNKQAELNRQKNLLKQKQDQLDDLNDRLIANQEKLGSEKIVKDNILSQTKGEESKYSQLITELKAEQNAINAEIFSLEIEARKRLYELNGDQFLASEKGFIWPVPSRRITSYFHDPDYPYRHIFEHPAIDIGSTPQGTPVRAVKSGYVAKVRNTGNSGGYNYIMLVHNEGLSSVYGHLNKMVILEDTFVVQGEIIGYSGGMPGTIGAGRLTTGPHMHLEIRKNGIPTNPLNYLP